MNGRWFARKFAAITAIGCLFLTAGNERVAAQEAPEATKLPRGLADVVKLVESGVGEEVVLAYVQNSPVPKPGAAELIELHRAKVPARVIVALLSRKQKPEQTVTPAAPAQAPTVYVERQPVYVQRDPVVVYTAPPYVPHYYYPRYRYDWPGLAVGLAFGAHHIFGHHGFGHHRFGHHAFGHHRFGHHRRHHFFGHGFGGHHGHRFGGGLRIRHH